MWNEFVPFPSHQRVGDSCADSPYVSYPQIPDTGGEVPPVHSVCQVRTFKRRNGPVWTARCWGSQEQILSDDRAHTPSPRTCLLFLTLAMVSYGLIPHGELSTSLRLWLGYRGSTTFPLTWKKNTHSLSAERPVNSDQLWLSHLSACPSSLSAGS